ncbi:hypothetical protein KUH03_17555 [Sphingobacterium sp. E70]|uniref:hypothetical protein n=1 Tax=Sphingobacterium sp. E70 TaxID=2853439 RepID=UPI00211C99E7|nr:hypothetical protein [Sphingobacterium sp. E70]ULT28234.1 hypothetical protein KUH03_17555 [Sphingobacterium sp. E70]
MKILITASMTLVMGSLFAQQETTIDTVPRRQDALNKVMSAIPAVSGEINPDTIPTTDGFYQANNMEDAVPFAYPEVNKKNIRFYKRVWRDIDLKDEKTISWLFQEIP